MPLGVNGLDIFKRAPLSPGVLCKPGPFGSLRRSGTNAKAARNASQGNGTGHQRHDDCGMSEAPADEHPAKDAAKKGRGPCPGRQGCSPYVRGSPTCPAR